MKKKFLKIAVITLSSLLLFIAGVALYVRLMLPNVGNAQNVKILMTPERIERGKYLSDHVAGCIDCHSTRDWNTLYGPIVEGTEGKGGDVFSEQMGFPGNYFASNITPAGVENWTDGELLRAITTGVSKNGDALFPIMPYHAFGKVDEEDIKSIIAYVRTLKRIENKVPESTSNFPMNFIINTMPQKADFHKMPDKSDVLNYGKYLITMADCIDCHTKKTDKGELIVGLEYAGGFEFSLPGGIVRSMNITPDIETGIGKWGKDFFIKRFKLYADSSYENRPVYQGSFNSVMPWTMMAGMTEEDLGAIYTYLRTVKPVKNVVEKFSTKK
ncbi:MAG: cytochrome C [Bacteroidota bacterium]|nr:cytochrome C [Bacteroidota bacterium]